MQHQLISGTAARESSSPTQPSPGSLGEFCVESLRCSAWVCCAMLCIPEALSGPGSSAQALLWFPLLHICPHCLERGEWMFLLDYLPPLDVQTSEPLRLAITLSSWKEVVL